MSSRLPLLLAGLASFGAGLVAAAPPAEAQATYRFQEHRGQLVLTVRPRSWLDAGNVVRPGSLDNPATSPHMQTASYLNLPPYISQVRDRGGFVNLPDPIQNGPFVGARNPFDQAIDFGPFSGRRY